MNPAVLLLALSLPMSAYAVEIGPGCVYTYGDTQENFEQYRTCYLGFALAQVESPIALLATCSNVGKECVENPLGGKAPAPRCFLPLFHAMCDGVLKALKDDNQKQQQAEGGNNE